MALAAVGAIAGGIGSVVSGAINAASQNAITEKQIDSNQLMQNRDIDFKLKALQSSNQNNLDVQNLQGNTSRDVANTTANASRDVANISGLTAKDVANIAGQWQNSINERNTQTQLKLQRQEFDRAQMLRDNLVGQLKSAGLPEYLAYVQPDESMLQTRRVGGHNVTIYKGSNMSLYGIQR